MIIWSVLMSTGKSRRLFHFVGTLAHGPAKKLCQLVWIICLSWYVRRLANNIRECQFLHPHTFPSLSQGHAGCASATNGYNLIPQMEEVTVFVRKWSKCLYRSISEPFSPVRSTQKNGSSTKASPVRSFSQFQKRRKTLPLMLSGLHHQHQWG